MSQTTGFAPGFASTDVVVMIDGELVGSIGFLCIAEEEGRARDMHTEEQHAANAMAEAIYAMDPFQNILAWKEEEQYWN